MYIACEGETEQPEDYLTFTSQSPEGDDDPQQNYETMTDDPLDTYEEPGHYIAKSVMTSS